MKNYYFNQRGELVGMFTAEEAQARLEEEYKYWNGNSDERPVLIRGREVK